MVRTTLAGLLARFRSKTIMEEVGVCADSVSRWKAGTAFPDARFIEPLSAFLGISPDRLGTLVATGQAERNKARKAAKTSARKRPVAP